VTAVGRTTILLFVAFFGWEAITHLSAEFRDPARDVPRATFLAVFLVTAIYLGVAFAVVSTGTYGDPELDRVAVARVLSDSLGVGAEAVAAIAAVVITLGTTNAIIAATSRLGYALGRDGALPRALGRLDRRGVPEIAVAAVGTLAFGGLGLAYAEGWGAEKLLVVPNSLIMASYVIAMAAGTRLLEGRARGLALVGLLLCAAVAPFAGVSLVLPLSVGTAALVYKRLGSWRRVSEVRPGPRPG
jgi:amino acid efflux transporter